MAKGFKKLGFQKTMRGRGKTMMSGIKKMSKMSKMMSRRRGRR